MRNLIDRLAAWWLRRRGWVPLPPPKTQPLEPYTNSSAINVIGRKESECPNCNCFGSVLINGARLIVCWGCFEVYEEPSVEWNPDYFNRVVCNDRR